MPRINSDVASRADHDTCMAPVVGRADNELGDRSAVDQAHQRRRLDMEENRPDRDLGAQGHDYEYDEAHDVAARQLREPPKPHRVDPPPQSNFGAGGDYGYDEAHDFGA
jgi:hypothetical protein